MGNSGACAAALQKGQAAGLPLGASGESASQARWAALIGADARPVLVVQMTGDPDRSPASCMTTDLVVT